MDFLALSAKSTTKGRLRIFAPLRSARVDAAPDQRLGRARGLAPFAPNKTNPVWHEPRRHSRPATLRCAAFLPRVPPGRLFLSPCRSRERQKKPTRQDRGLKMLLKDASLETV